MKSYTDIKQSRVLAKILPFEVAPEDAYKKGLEIGSKLK